MHILKHIFKDTINESNPVLNRKKYIINRLYIGHTKLTHEYLMTRDDKPICNILVDSYLTIKYTSIFTDYHQYSDDLYSNNLLCTLNIALRPDTDINIKLLNFLKLSNLYKEIE